MNLDFPAPNVICRCGVMLLSWEDVLKHWESHQETRRQWREFQRAFNEARGKKPATSTAWTRGSSRLKK